MSKATNILAATGIVLWTGVDHVLTTVEATALTVAEPVVQVGKVAGNTFVTKYLEERQVRTDIKVWFAGRRQAKAQKALDALMAAQAAARTSTTPSPEVAPLPKSKPATKRTPAPTKSTAAPAKRTAAPARRPVKA